MNEGLEKLGESAFYKTAIQSIDVPSTLKRIEEKMFYCCKDLRSVKIPNGVKHIGKSSFSLCALESVVFPASVEEIDEEAFYGNKLQEVVFTSGSKLKTVGACAFG